MKKVSIFLTMMLVALHIAAQSPANIRYVSKNGAYANDGRTWATAKLNVQDAINDLVNNKLTGEVWVAEGTYTPTESTEASGGSTLYMSFKIPEGITVRGGFRGKVAIGDVSPTTGQAATEAYPGETTLEERLMKEYPSIGNFYLHHTVLSGNLSSKAKFTWNEEKEQWNTTYYGNTYHVVWFATKGFDPSTGRANPIANDHNSHAVLEGCVVTGGNAHNNSVTGRTHNAYGGGVYMVAGTTVANCWIYNCSASRDGGGVYMDGGGTIEHSYVQDCQALGIGVQNGFGGGVCVDGLESPVVGSEPYVQTNPKAYVVRTGITGCVGRMGGGLAFNTHDTKLKYNLCASAVLVSNNTATTEAGGVYVNRGAALTQMTIVKNKCNGTGITINGMQTGRSAGLYIRDNAHVANSMMWGGKAEANNDIQYASSRSSATDELKPSLYFSMLSKADHVDWSGTQKMNVEKLSDYNNMTALQNAGGTEVKSEAFPMFLNPSDKAGYMENVGLRTITALDVNGVPTMAPDPEYPAFKWQVNPRSAATHRGVLTYDLDTEHITPARQTTPDILGVPFTARVTIGAYNSRPVAGLPDMYALDSEGKKYMFDFKADGGNGKFIDDNGTPDNKSDDVELAKDNPLFVKKVANLYVDPNEGDQEEQEYNSGSWDTPAKYLPDALYYIKTWWLMPQYQVYFSQLDTINVYVKEGTVYNTSAHYEGHVRNATIEIPHLKRFDSERPIHLNIIGGMDKSLTGTDVSKRDPLHHPTVIVGDILEDYEQNTSHLVTFNGCHDVVFDGFQIRNANAKSTLMENNDQNGAAMYFKANTDHIADDECGELDGMAYKCLRIKVKNVLVANNTAVNGAAVYAVDDSRVDFENCIFHNNQASQADIVSASEKNGIVYAAAGTQLSFKHCDVLRNVGYAFAGEGSISMTNSMVYANMKQPLEDTNDHAADALKPMATGTTVTGSNNMFDTQSGDVSALGESIFTFNREDDDRYPRFINPTKNAGVSPKGDMTYYGRSVSFEPTNTNPMVNAASYDDPNHLTWGTDMSSNVRRDYGGRPDIGAIENHVAYSDENADKDGQPAYGSILYVKDYRNSDNSIDYAAGGDGTSWADAINGNAYYHEDGSHGSEPLPEEIGVADPELEEIKQVTTYDKGAAVTLPTTLNESVNVVMTSGSATGQYLVYKGPDASSLYKFTNTTDVAAATVFTITYVKQNATATSRGYTIQANYNGLLVYIGYTGTSSSASLTDTPTDANKTWYTTKNTGTSAYFANSTGTSKMYLYSNDKGYNTSPREFFFFTQDVNVVDQTISVNKAPARGLQYAINKGNERFQTDGGTAAHKKLVYVAEGTYTNSTSSFAKMTAASQPYAYMIKEGVDVYGGFPSSGNPGMSERNPKKYETILQAQTKSPRVIFNNRPAEDGGDYKATIADWGSCAHKNNGEEKTSVGRVLAQPKNFTVETKWDGFTVRHGYLMTAHMDNIGAKLTSENSGEGLNPGEIIKAGGAGVLLQEKGVLTNCVVTDNLILCSPRNGEMTVFGEDTEIKDANQLYTYHMAGAGIFMSGTLDANGSCSGNGAIVENCDVYGNQLLTKSQSIKPDNIWMYGGGVFQNGGQIYNTIVRDNDMMTIEGGTSRYTSQAQSDLYTNEMILGGVFIASGKFYNNTVVNNVAASLYSAHNNHCIFSGIHVFDAATVYNSIIADNKGRWYYTGGESPGNGVPVSAFKDDESSRTSRDANKIHVYYSFVDVNQGENLIDLVSKNDTENTNIYLNRAQHSTTKTPGLYTTASIYDHADGANKYHLFKNSPAVNTGTEAIDGVTIPSYDADYTTRVQDCVIDMGAHEYNGSYDITPDLTSEAGKAIYYVTPNGAGNASASSPMNAACAQKLQQVLDAAGRYKFLAASGKYGPENKEIKVIVKVANSYDDLHPDNGTKHPEDDGYIEPFDFKYSATRTTDESDDNARIWSIIVPHGVEVWGGYTDVALNDAGTAKLLTAGKPVWTDERNGFYKTVEEDLSTAISYTDLRNITANPTYFDGEFHNLKENSIAHSYHTITFCDRVYDGEGHPYLVGDYNSSTMTLAVSSSFDKNNAPTEDGYLHMSDEKEVIDADGKRNHNRAVVDGLFISGGNANADDANNALMSVGGAAVVTDFAHVRNCIILNNEAKRGGGLALANRGLVSGTLLMSNKADQGGAIYVIPNGVTLANTTVNNATDAPAGKAMDWNMPHVFTSTIVGNSATQAGGGIYYSNDDPNVRVNSCVIWNNEAPDQANIAGIVSPDKPAGNQNSTLAFYPFGYTAIQNLRASGTNNIKVESEATQGVRWEDLVQDPYYGLTDFSILARTGMPVGDYDALVDQMELSHIDFADVDRDIDTKAPGTRTFIDMGARAIDKNILRDELMLRLFVAQPEDINNDAAEALAAEANKPEPQRGSYPEGDDGDFAYGMAHDIWKRNRYYAQEGSSFAHPMHNLQDALDYIYDARSIDPNTGDLKYENANNLPFEICVAKGIYYPTRDLSGNYGQSIANTFLIPEGVTIVGGFNVNGGGGTYYGRYNRLREGGILTPSETLDAATGTYTTPTYYIDDNVDNVGDVDFVLGDNIVRIEQKSLKYMKERRDRADINANNIIEPWEFQNETVLDGNAVNAENTGVYHILTVVPDQNLVGALPLRSIERKAAHYDSNGDPVEGHEWLDREEGQSINLNGLTVRGGQAFNFVEGALDEMSNYSYYHGGAMLIDGNRYDDNYNKNEEDPGHVTYAKDAENNDIKQATYMHTGVSNAVGYRDIPVAISQCKFVNNKAGYGGAISTNTTVDVFMSAFEQNLAEANQEEDIIHNGDRYTVEYPGEGGAIYSTHQFSAFNTIFANNEARDLKYEHGIKPSTFKTLRNQNPSQEILGGAGGAIYSGIHGQFHLVNCNLVRNMANCYPAVFTMNPNMASQETASTTTPQYNQIVNTIAWGNEVNKTMQTKYNSQNEYFKFASGLICNYGNANRTGAYSATFEEGKMPMNQDQLDSEDFEETAWFSAYEDGKGKTQVNTNDFRDAEYRPFMHCKLQFAAHADLMGYAEGYQNCNISIHSDNRDLEGPNFLNPSSEAGFAGYVESADWSPARLNKMTDQGSGKILQKITANSDYTYESTFPSYEQAGLTVPAGREHYSEEDVSNVVTTGVYTMTRFLKDYKHYNQNLPLGADEEEFYMESANSSHQKLWRISFDPNPTHDQTYIDIGVYEYPHTELRFNTEDECDILWVSAGEKPENGLPDGFAWSQPTSDLQRAIETLLSSRNGHRKEIRLMDGTYTPIYSILNKATGESHLSFYINTEYQNGSVVLDAEDDGHGNKTPIEGLGIKSFTIKGGYSDELENMYDLEQYPAVFRGQNRTNEDETKWDHVFYIEDASQRYGKVGDYSESEKNGWVSSDIRYQDATPGALIPIEIDGITFVNNNAKANTKGAAIYYADQKFNEQGQRRNDGTVMASAPLPANVRKVKQYYYDLEHTRPAYEPTMFAEFESTTSGNKQDDYITMNHPAKFIMSKCVVMNSGTHYKPTQDVSSTSAVYIGREGGKAVLYNNVFHSNWGDPLEAYGALLVNNTFALNKGYAVLHDYEGKNNGFNGASYEETTTLPYNCSAFNNVFWRNGLSKADSYGYMWNFKFFDKDGTMTFDGKDHATLASCGSFFKNNAYSGGPTERTDYTPGDDLDTKQNYNVGLVDDNDNVIDGPNFTDPKTEATGADIETRKFTLQPSLRLINKGDNALYDNGVTYLNNGSSTSLNVSLTQSTTIYDYAWLPTTAHDAASKVRLVPNTSQGHIDLGAYEYQKNLERVIYVNPNVAVSGLGNTWADPIGQGYLQAAIDLAGVYCVNHPGDQAYVFVKGSNVGEEKHTGERITLRDGVHIYGGINPGYGEDAREHVTDEYDNDDILAYIQKIRNTRLGVADANSFKTRVTGIRTSSTTKFNSNVSALVDGFIVTPVGGSTPVEPAINVNPTITDNNPKIALRNVIVSDFDLSGTPTVNAANIDHALLYEALFRDNKVADSKAVLNMGADGYGVNLTVEGKTTGADGSEALNGGTESSSHIINSIVNYSTGATDFTSEVARTLSGYSYPLADKNLNYQLAEGSKQIDVCAATVPNTVPALYREGTSPLIDYQTDRDLLGNPRILALGTEATNTLDRGAFETWRIAKNTQANTTSGVYGGNYYPHAGSVLYIEKGKSFVSAHELEPGYLLVKDGASLYGNGFDVKAGYVAVERSVSTNGNVIALPYDMDYKKFDSDAKTGVATVKVDASGVLTQDPFAGKNVYRYDSDERADWQYTFADKESDCWKDASGIIPANQGILYIPNADGTTVRFTSKGATANDYIYTETGTNKVVTLLQHNAGGRVASTPGASPEGANGNTGNNADFTDADDMGWNAIGLPYLVSQYQTYNKVSVEGNSVALLPNTAPGYNAAQYQMHIPHTLWMWYDGQTYSDGTNKADGDGGFYSVSSWDGSDWHTTSTPCIWTGEGFFAQTATLAADGKEALTFYRPVPDMVTLFTAPARNGDANAGNAGKTGNAGNASKTGNADNASATIIGTPINSRYYVTTDIRPTDEHVGKQIVATRYYTADGIQHSRPVRGVTIQVDIYDDGSRQTRKFMGK